MRTVQIKSQLLRVKKDEIFSVSVSLPSLPSRANGEGHQSMPDPSCSRISDKAHRSSSRYRLRQGGLLPALSGLVHPPSLLQRTYVVYDRFGPAIDVRPLAIGDAVLVAGDVDHITLALWPGNPI